MDFLPGSIGILPSRLYIVLISSGLNKITILPLPRPGVDNLQHTTQMLLSKRIIVLLTWQCPRILPGALQQTSACSQHSPASAAAGGGPAEASRAGTGYPHIWGIGIEVWIGRKEELLFIPLGILPLLHHPGTCGYPPPLCSETSGNGLVTETQQPPHAARAEHCDSVWSNSCNCSDGHWDYGQAAADWEDQIKSHLIREQYQIVIQEDDQKS